MRKLTITNVGPIIKTATIEYERFCILIGPQSNGKSTIAKILSTCMWLEKEACTTLKNDVVKDGDGFKQLVEDFHRMHNYIHPDSSIIEYYSKSKTIFYFISSLDLCYTIIINFYDFISFCIIYSSFFIFFYNVSIISSFYFIEFSFK